MAAEQHRYLQAGKAASGFNAIVRGLTKLGVSVMGTRVLYVRGRKTGEWRETPVNLLPFEGEQYLVAPRGHTQWVRNLRVAGEGRLRVGRRVRTFTAVELPDEEKAPLLREYLRRWAWEVGAFFENLDTSSPEEDLRRAAPGFPVFRITYVTQAPNAR
ncbi:deazaflavin-dependent oxidoreductase (nitroreductase family) [Prauserella shujinwangii]|uniref:Deazaflavin-dependent oxidoreductase (Nitroreductase family) n=1 Tax=Prauserella shujinwangii TaxID=1453103 RepID=A0A2T0LN38_9PSEU|nr:nitroreductase family deazaflavin-dependent oxidoreductase [Prauserella shujinwangii]PRX44612.1 deazaflavin-dependent oxidoreductase (nitroreductase family) [Prauserella shujinwangii]